MNKKQKRQFKAFLEGKGLFDMFEAYVSLAKATRKERDDISTIYSKASFSMPITFMLGSYIGKCPKPYDRSFWEAVEAEWRTANEITGDDIDVLIGRVLFNEDTQQYKFLVTGKPYSDTSFQMVNVRYILPAEANQFIQGMKSMFADKHLSLEDVRKAFCGFFHIEQTTEAPAESCKTTSVGAAANKDYTFHDFTASNRYRGSHYIQDNNFRITSKKGTHRVTFNAKLSKLLDEAGMTHLRVREDNLTGELHFVFNKTDGLPIWKPADKPGNSIHINNIDLCEFLRERLHVPASEEVSVHEIGSNIANTKEYYTARIILK